MKRLLILLCFSVITHVATCPNTEKCFYLVRKPPVEPFETLYTASKYIESSDNSNAFNPSENAFGEVQIRMIRLKDYNARTGKHYKLKDCFDPKISKEIYLYYCGRFNPNDLEGIAKSWNGKGKSNEIYWQKIKSKMAELKK